MSKLFELLAVEPTRKAEAQRALGQTMSLFTQGINQLVGKTRVYYPIEEEGETFPTEHTEVVTTVQTALAELAAGYGPWLDVAFQKEVTNRSTRAHIAITRRTLTEGENLPLIDDVPAPALLNLEGKLTELRKVFAAIPTLDPTMPWDWDDDEGLYISRETERIRTEKRPQVIVKYDATPEHPAQTELFTKDVRVGTWREVVRSGAFTVKDKKAILDRVDALIRAVKQARQRANDIEADNTLLAERIFAYILTGSTELF